MREYGPPTLATPIDLFSSATPLVRDCGDGGYVDGPFCLFHDGSRLLGLFLLGGRGLLLSM